MSIDKAYCPACDEAFAISETADEAVPLLLESPPAGTWIRQDFDRSVIAASTRSAGAFFLVPFLLAWGGGSLGGIYGTQLLRGEFDLFKSLFGLPFLAGTVFLGILTLMSLFGRIEIRTGRQAALFIGVGSIGWTRPFEWSAVRSIRMLAANPNQDGAGSRLAIEFTHGAPLTVGVGLSPRRQAYLVAALRRELAQRG